ncbi:ATP-dependent RNA helicase HrpA [Halorhodospira neutriphila]|uniref:ATP-dependent RNA helicase HrpA n=1 Tax=Halorhodospira neutriphila TaxID=168379 RepID=A0ABS1E4X8_9GAMM|nr:ATP-dependent RNA helicase HrpA [Halorhodospira neutriphila]MBK1726796.1 ATP-dependent RNA helicase HrpA [Halorhodospira neutriphila]
MSRVPPSLEALRGRIEAAFGPDRPGLRRRLAGLERRARQGKPFDRGRDRLERDLATSEARVEQRRRSGPALAYDPELPVVQRREELLEALDEHQVVVVCGATGSGKSTQLPKMALELGLGARGLIGHTQPRRIAARSLAERLAEETGTEVGGAVGYKVRFTDQVGEDSRVKLLTDGMLLAEIQSDRHLDAYDTLIIDEAHERSLNIDFILGYLKRLLPRRPDLKVIVTSATIDPERFSRHFDDAPVLEVSGRTYPVELRYRPYEERDGVELPQAVAEAVHELAGEGPGDTLVFLPGEREIRECAEALRKDPPRGTEILPLYARLSSAEQQRVFHPGGGRRVVLATNVAETSLTVPGIRYVVDSGRARISRYSHRTKVSRLPVEPIAQASADQRAGRCGREAPGICIRLYGEADYAGRPRFTDPEILRTNLAGVILQMKAMGLGEIERFPFVEPPERRYINDALRQLFELGAVDAARELTELGRRLARIPADPRIARMLLAAEERGVAREVLVIAAGLSIQDPRERPMEAQEAADQAHARWRDPKSDFAALLRLWEDYQAQRRALSRRKLTQWCREHFLAPQRMREWADIRRQFAEMLKEAAPQRGGSSGESAAGGARGGTQAGDRAAGQGEAEGAEALPYEAVHRALLTGLLGQVACHYEERTWMGPRGVKLQVFPGSGLAKRKPKWIVAAELVETRRLFARTVAEIRPGWIEAAAGHLVSRSYSDPHWEKRAGRVVAYEQVSLYGLTLASGRKVDYARIDPDEARRIFIRDGLVAGEIRTRGAFLAHNQALVDEVERLEAKARRRDVLADEEQLAAFYEARIPGDIRDAAAFERWRKRAERRDPQRLYMTREALMRRDAEEISEAQYPDRLTVRGVEIPLEYCLEPGSEHDGVTAVIPVAALNQLPPEAFEWLVPGLLHEKVTALIRGLPKAQRRHFVPAPEFARAALEAIPRGEGSLIDAVARHLQRITGVELPPGALEAVELPAHLCMAFRVVDAEGAVLAEGRDLPALQAQLSGAATEQFAAAGGGAAAQWYREGITRWDFDELPESVTLEEGGVTYRGYPALRDEGDAVTRLLLDAPEAAERESRAGVRRLFMLALPQQVRALRKLDELKALRLKYRGLGSDDELREALLRAAFDRCFLGEGLPRDAAAFEQRLAAGRGELVATAQSLCRALDEVLTRYQALRKALKQLNSPALLESLRDIDEHLGSLVFPGFLEALPAERLAELPRYLRALERRVEKLRLDPSKDRAPLRTVRPWHERVHQRLAERAERSAPDPTLEQLRWLLEEYRVSLFAQEVGAREKVSEKRLEALWREVA